MTGFRALKQSSHRPLSVRSDFRTRGKPVGGGCSSLPREGVVFIEVVALERWGTFFGRSRNLLMNCLWSMMIGMMVGSEESIRRPRFLDYFFTKR